MKKKCRIMLALFVSTLALGALEVVPCLSAGSGDASLELSRDGSAVSAQNQDGSSVTRQSTRITQAERQAAADRAAAKGFVPPKVGAATTPGENPQAEGGANK